MGDEVQNIGHVLDLAERAYTRGIYTYSAFLSIEEQSRVKTELTKKSRVRFGFYGGSDASIRKIAIFGDEDELMYEPVMPIAVIKISPVSIKFAEELSHRDYLGAIMNLGIDRANTGDIIIKDKTAWLFCLEGIAGYIRDNLNKVRHTDVRCSICEGDVPEIRPELCELKINVTSERLDCICAALISGSRSTAQALIRDEKVFVNEKCMTNTSCSLKENDIIVIRGVGKFIYDGIGSYTKKGRIYIMIKKYV